MSNFRDCHVYCRIRRKYQAVLWGPERHLSELYLTNRSMLGPSDLALPKFSSAWRPLITSAVFWGHAVVRLNLLTCKCKANVLILCFISGTVLLLLLLIIHIKSYPSWTSHHFLEGFYQLSYTIRGKYIFKSLWQKENLHSRACLIHWWLFKNE